MVMYLMFILAINLGGALQPMFEGGSAAFVIDRLMQSLGLPGKSFVPLIVGFGCNVPTRRASG